MVTDSGFGSPWHIKLPSPNTLKFKLPHVYAAVVISTIWGLKKRKKVCKPVPSPIEDKIPNAIQYPYHINVFLIRCNFYY